MSLLSAGKKIFWTGAGAVSAPASFTDVADAWQPLMSLRFKRNTLMDLYHVVRARALIENPSTTTRMDAHLLLATSSDGVDVLGPLHVSDVLYPHGSIKAQKTLIICGLVRIPKDAEFDPATVIYFRSDGPFAKVLSSAIGTTSVSSKLVS